MLHSINPANGQTLASFDEADNSAVDAALERARHAQHAWRRQAPAERARVLARVAQVLRRHRDGFQPQRFSRLCAGHRDSRPHRRLHP